MKNIILSRTDSIGDVILTLPMAAVIKANFPDTKIYFLGKIYTKPIIKACKYIDEFIELNDFLADSFPADSRMPEAIIHVFPVKKIAERAKKLKIPTRIGTRNRWYHWFTCNKLVKLSRKKSTLHESQLNLKLLESLSIKTSYTLDEIKYFEVLENIYTLPVFYKNLLQKDKYNLIIHPKSQGSAREWGVDNFIELIKVLDKDKVRIFVSGTEKEKEAILPILAENGVIDIVGKLSLEEFVAFITNADGLLANSTGPLHIAAALGKDAFGLYPPMKPIHPARWAPIGENVHIFVENKTCDACRKTMQCACMKNIKPQEVAKEIEKKISL